MVVKKEKQLQGNINKKNRSIQVLNGNRSIRLKYYYRLLHSSRHETVYILNCINGIDSFHITMYRYNKVYN